MTVPSNGSATQPVPDRAPAAAGPVITIANEFAMVCIQKVKTSQGDRIEIHSPNLGYRVHLDPLQLEALSWQKPDFFSALLVTPFGPEDVH
jgi:hypothetical protein